MVDELGDWPKWCGEGREQAEGKTETPTYGVKKRKSQRKAGENARETRVTEGERGTHLRKGW